jgi:hypothetical protein
MGNCANFVASNVFITKQAPKYPTGFATGVGFASLAVVSILVVTAALALHNRRFDQESRDGAEKAEDQENFRYVL